MRFFAFILLFVWVFSGWLQVWEDLGGQLKIKQVQAQTVVNILPSAKHANDTTNDTLSGITGDDATENPDTATTVNTSDNIYTVDKNLVMHIDTFDVSSIPGGSTISAAVLHLQYGAEDGYDGTNPVRYNNGGGLTTTGITPSDITGWSSDLTFNLYAAGVDTRTEIQNLDIEFTSNDGKGPSAIHFDYIWITVTYTTSGTLTADIVDGSYASISSPTMAMDNAVFSFNCQTITGSFGTASQQIYVNNNSGANNGWTLTLAAQATTNIWDSAGTDYDFNDPTSSGCADGADADSLSGQMTVDPSGATLAVGQCGSCSTANISKGSSASFNEGTVDTITLLNATAASDDIGDWTLQGVSISQKIPAEQPVASDYNINMVLTVAAS